LSSEFLIEVKEIEKSFPGVKALKGVSFNVRKGEVDALCGENGAGKSTLIKVMTGAHQPDSGKILVDGKETRFNSPQQAIEMGIACIYQELSIVPQVDLAHNIYVGNLPLKPGSKTIDKKKLYSDTSKILEMLGLPVSPKTLAGELSIAQQQMIEIGRALSRNARCIIMDEPTSSLSDAETEILFGLIEKLKASQVAIIYISHKLNEVMRISDRITVIRDGENVITKNTRDFTEAELIENIIGRDASKLYIKSEAQQGDEILEVRGLTKHGVFEDISFSVKQGEILGFFGLVGAGRTEIMRAVFGVDRYDSGSVTVNGTAVKRGSPRNAIKNGICYCSEDRKKEGLALILDVMSNMTLPSISRLKKAGIIDRKVQRQVTDEYIQRLNIKTSSKSQLAGNLSGGNQQKIVIAKWLMMHPKVLILDEPTRGIDVGSKAEIYKLVSVLAQNSVAVIFVSSELQELIGICDRIITVCEGRITGNLMVKEVTDSQILAAALGGGC
jgi:ABC-type sugar transport system ATPase subunit